MASQLEVAAPGEFIASESPGTRSRENITIASGAGVLGAGTVLGANLGLAVGRVSVPTVVGTGNGVVTKVYAGPDCVVGNYVATCTATATHGGTFSVVGPNGALPSLVLTAGAGVATNYRSREINFTIADGSTDYAANDVFTFVVGATAPVIVGTGDGTISALSLGGRAVQAGNYQLRCSLIATHGGTWVGTDPAGNVFGTFVLTPGAGGTSVLTSDGINFSITDGSTDFAVGDYFNVAVYKNAATKYVAYDPSPTAFDGRHIAAGVLYAEVDATSADVAAVALVRDCEVVSSRLKWVTGMAAPEQAFGRADLATLGIIAR
jgi:hypothetical protein